MVVKFELFLPRKTEKPRKKCAQLHVLGTFCEVLANTEILDFLFQGVFSVYRNTEGRRLSPMRSPRRQNHCQYFFFLIAFIYFHLTAHLVFMPLQLIHTLLRHQAMTPGLNSLFCIIFISHFLSYIVCCYIVSSLSVPFNYDHGFK